MNFRSTLFARSSDPLFPPFPEQKISVFAVGLCLLVTHSAFKISPGSRSQPSPLSDGRLQSNQEESKYEM